MSEPFSDLGDAISDPRFVDVDLSLRRGQHIDHDDADWYGYLLDAQAVLEPFYRRYGCELVHRSDGYFFLLPTGEKVAKRLLGVPEMVVGQGAALLYLDPATIESGGVVSKEDLLSHLAAVMGTDALVAVFNPKRKRMDERVAQETVRQRVAEGLRKLTQLGFVTLSEDNRVHLRSALMRFADPVRGAGSPRDALEKLIARGEVSIPPDADVADEADEDQRDAGASVSGDAPPAGVEFITPGATTGGDTTEDETDAAASEDGEDESADDESTDDESTDDESADDEYVFDRDAQDEEEDEARVEEDFEASLGEDLGADFDHFGVDFDEPPVSKAASPEVPTSPEAPASPPEENKEKPRKKRPAESVHPEPAGDSMIPSANQNPEFDEFD